jgi:Zn-finger nucleic acid-binding protein
VARPRRARQGHRASGLEERYDRPPRYDDDRRRDDRRDYDDRRHYDDRGDPRKRKRRSFLDDIFDFD